MSTTQTGSGVVPIDWGSPQFRTRHTQSLQITDAWFPPNAALPPHIHDRAVVAVTLSGAIQSRLPGRSVLGRAGEVWTEPLGEPHANRVGPDGARVLVIQPDPSLVEVLRPCGHLLDGVHHFRHGGIAHLARRIQGELRRESDVASLMLEGVGLEILSWGTDRATLDRPGAPWFLRVLELVHDRFREHLSIDEIAVEAGVHPAHLTRVFKAQTGVSLGRYIRALRLEWAAGQLGESDDPIGRIALQAGFSDQSHFSRVFKKYMGATPREYRRHRH